MTLIYTRTRIYPPPPPPPVVMYIRRDIAAPSCANEAA
jgi:hypothetical protein